MTAWDCGWYGKFKYVLLCDRKEHAARSRSHKNNLAFLTSYRTYIIALMTKLCVAHDLKNKLPIVIHGTCLVCCECDTTIEVSSFPRWGKPTESWLKWAYNLSNRKVASHYSTRITTRFWCRYSNHCARPYYLFMIYFSIFLLVGNFPVSDALTLKRELPCLTNLCHVMSIWHYLLDIVALRTYDETLESREFTSNLSDNLCTSTRRRVLEFMNSKNLYRSVKRWCMRHFTLAKWLFSISYTPLSGQNVSKYGLRSRVRAFLSTHLR